MRENMGLYRGKRIDNGKWAEGYFVKSDGRINNGRCYILPEANNFRHSDGNASVIGNFVSVDQSTVGEFTGLSDKNGKQIFEGDFVATMAGKPYEIVFADGGFSMDGTAISFRFATKFSIIGNIHDNPELKGAD